MPISHRRGGTTRVTRPWALGRPDGPTVGALKRAVMRSTGGAVRGAFGPGWGIASWGLLMRISHGGGGTTSVTSRWSLGRPNVPTVVPLNVAVIASTGGAPAGAGPVSTSINAGVVVLRTR